MNISGGDCEQVYIVYCIVRFLYISVICLMPSRVWHVCLSMKFHMLLTRSSEERGHGLACTWITPIESPLKLLYRNRTPDSVGFILKITGVTVTDDIFQHYTVSCWFNIKSNFICTPCLYCTCTCILQFYTCFVCTLPCSKLELSKRRNS